MLSRLSSGSGPLWLLQHSISPSATFCPLLLLPGDGGEAVEVEAPLLLACSPLLRRTLASTCCGSCFSWPATVILPSTTSAALHQLAQVLGQGSVTIAADDLDELSGLFALLEVDFGRAAGAKRKTAKSDLETPPTVLKNSTSEGIVLSTKSSCSVPTASSPTAGPSRTIFDPTPSKLVAFNSSRPSLADSIPLPNASGDTAHKVKSPAEKLLKSSIACFFCDLIMPSGTDQNLYLQHLETCNARQVLEAEHLRKTLKTDKEVIESVERSQGGSNTEEEAIQNKRLKRICCKEPGCGRKYVNSRELAAHSRSVHGSAKLKCQEQSCTVEFIREQHLNQHMWAKHGVGKGPTCDVCEKRLARVEDLRDHMRSSHGAPEVKCDMFGCGGTFKFENSLRQHMKSIHGALQS